MYDHVKPATWPDTLGKEPLFAWFSSAGPSVGFSDRSHDVPKVLREICVSAFDVEPPFFGQHDAAAVGVPDDGKHVVKIEYDPDSSGRGLRIRRRLASPAPARAALAFPRERQVE